MNIENIKALADIVTANKLTALEVIEGDLKIRIKKEQPTQQVSVMPAPVAASVAAPVATAVSAAQESVKTESAEEVDHSHLIEVKSPLVGVFYSAPSPDSEMFVTLGSKVKKGDVLCIIEAMKLMNEITAEQDGEIVDICIKNGDVAEFGQVLFKMA